MTAHPMPTQPHEDVAADTDPATAETGTEGHRCKVTRRRFLQSTAAATATYTVWVTMNPGSAEAAKVPATVATYPRKLVGKLSKLVADEPLDFSYPDEGAYAESFIVKMGKAAGGGIGPDNDVVAFNYACTHQGGPMQGTYGAENKSLGPCPLHLSTYDLVRHGILISGQAYQSLPQVLLELDGDDIYAVGIFGLIYGRYDNLQS